MKLSGYAVCFAAVCMLAFSAPVGVYAATSNTADDAGSSGDELMVVMVGDILLHDGIEQCALQEDGSYDFSPIFKHTKDVIESADIAIVNEEVIIGGRELRVTGYPSFNAPYEIADELADTGFDVICHATNHALDRGKQGIINCLTYWGENHPDVNIVGIHDSEEDSDRICVINRDGISIAVLNYTYGTNGIAHPKGMPYAVDVLNESKIRDDIKRAGELSDITIVCPHWGTEYNLGISDMQKKWAKLFADCGADIIIGTHPHVIEPVGEITADDGRKVPVFYSLGNFINWTSGSGRGIANRMVGAMAMVKIAKDDKGNAVVSDFGAIPVVSHVRSEKNGSTVFFLEDYTQANSFLNEIRSRDRDFSYEYCVKLCNDVLKDSMIDKTAEK